MSRTARGLRAWVRKPTLKPVSPRHGSLASLAALALAAVSPRLPIVHAQAVTAAISGALQECVGSAVEKTRSAGIAPGAERTRFLLSGDTQVFTQRFSGTECVGFLAAGARHAQSLELVIQAADGSTLAHSATPSALAYAVHCGHAGDLVFATVRMLDGQGEIVYVPLEHAGTQPAVLRSLEQCSALGTPRPAPVEVGPDPAGKSIEQQFEVVRAELSEIGYGADRVVAYGTLNAGHHDAQGVVLTADRCYALVAVGSRDVLDLDMRVFGPTLPLSSAGSDLSRKRNAVVKLCAEAPARYVVDVSAFQGAGAYAVQAFELVDAALVASITGKSRIAYAELTARMQARGMLAKPLTSGIVKADDVLGIPLSFKGGTCYAVGVVASSELDVSALQLGLENERGELIGLDSRADDPPLVFHCSARDEQLHAMVRPNQTRSDARFVLLLGSEAVRAE
jgi:hypothetical protein